MPQIAIIGAGALGGALAHKLASRNRVAEVRLIDPAESVAQGKALDIVQSGPVEGYNPSVKGFGSLHAAAGSDVVIIADAVAGAEHAGEAGLALLRQLITFGSSEPILFAGAGQRELMSRCVTELHVAPARLAGSAPMALGAAVRALTAVVGDASAKDVSLYVVGVPPRDAVVAWQGATLSGQPLRDVLGPHEIAAMTARIPSLWPPGPYALASAAAIATEALCFGSRQRLSCFVDVGRGRVAAMPVVLGPGGVQRIVEPSLTTQERTALDNALERDSRR